MTQRYIGLWVRILITFLLTLSFLFAKTDSVRVRVRVTDQQGTFLPRATVTLTNPETGRNQTTTTDASGAYNFDVVQRGHYKIQAEQKGFKVATAEFTLEVSQVREVNLQLQV